VQICIFFKAPNNCVLFNQLLLFLGLTDLQIMLDLLKMPELKNLMQNFQLPVTGRKQTMMNALICHGKKQCSIFPTAKGSPVKKNILSAITER
jgi:hypothetical protein